MKLRDIVFKMHDNAIGEFIVVYIKTEESIHPYGTFGFDSSNKYGITIHSQFKKEQEASGSSRQFNPIPTIYEVRANEVFKTKEELLKSLV